MRGESSLAGVAGRNYGTVHYIWEPNTYVVFRILLDSWPIMGMDLSRVPYVRWKEMSSPHLWRPHSSLSPHQCWTTSYLTVSPYCWWSHYTACGVWHSFRVQVLENLWTFLTAICLVQVIVFIILQMCRAVLVVQCHVHSFYLYLCTRAPRRAIQTNLEPWTLCASSYQGITLFSVITKTLEVVLLKRNISYYWWAWLPWYQPNSFPKRNLLCTKLSPPFFSL